MFSSPSTNARTKSSPDCKRSPRAEKPEPVPPNAIPMGRNWNKTDEIAALHATYQQIVEVNAGDYAQAGSKKIVSQRIAKQLEAKGIRFVRWNPKKACWEDAPAESTIKKISAACREWKNTKQSSLQISPKKAREAKKDVYHSLSKDPIGYQTGKPTSATTNTTTTNTSSELPLSSRRPSRAAAMAATVAIAQSSKMAGSQQSKVVVSPKSLPPSQCQIMQVNDTTVCIRNSQCGGLVDHLSPECSEMHLGVVVTRGGVLEPNPIAKNSSAPLHSTSNTSSQPVALSNCRKLGSNWVKPQYSKRISNKRALAGSSTRYPTRSKKVRIDSEYAAEEKDSQTPVTTTLLPPEFQPPETSSCIKTVLSTEEIVAPIVSSDDSDKETPVEKIQEEEAIAKDCVTPDLDIDTETRNETNQREEDGSESRVTRDMNVLSIPNDMPQSPRESEPWWSGMQTIQSPFLVQTDGLFDHYSSESFQPSSPLGLFATLDLLSDFEETLEHSCLSNLSPSFSIPPCQFEILEDFESTSHPVDTEVLASPAKLELDANTQES